MNKIPDLYEKIYEIVRAIPKGRVTSYGAIARALGATSGARVVGYAMNKASLVRPSVPAHRVVNRNGMLTGKHHFPEKNSMEQLLKQEGIIVIDDKVASYEKLFWDPQKEIKIQ